VKYVRFLVRFVVVLVLLALGALVYLHTLGFPQFARDFLLGQLRKVGIEARFGTIRLDAFRGLVATSAVAAGVSLGFVQRLQIVFMPSPQKRHRQSLALLGRDSNRSAEVAKNQACDRAKKKGSEAPPASLPYLGGRAAVAAQELRRNLSGRSLPYVDRLRKHVARKI